MSINKTHKVTDHMPIVSQFYPGMYTQVVPQQQQGESKARRRRKKNRGGETGVSEIKKRKLTAEQTNLLEQNFGNDQKLESERKDKLALELGLDPRQVAVWFQNKRARWKNKKIEEEYSKLKMAHETAIVEKCRLETEVLKLKEQLSEAEKQIQRRAIAEPTSMVSSNSPSSSLTMTVIDPPFFGEFGMEGYEEALYMPESTYIHNNMEWFNLYM